jgi:hypothetical protein
MKKPRLETLDWAQVGAFSLGLPGRDLPRAVQLDIRITSILGSLVTCPGHSFSDFVAQHLLMIPYRFNSGIEILSAEWAGNMLSVIIDNIPTIVWPLD